MQFASSRYIGTYGSFSYGNISVVEVADGNLRMLYGTRGVFDLVNVAGDVFAAYADRNPG